MIAYDSSLILSEESDRSGPRISPMPERTHAAVDMPGQHAIVIAALDLQPNKEDFYEL
jgi:hypothetical protein